ncbi:MAG: T9SS type A sorting domain-containing protein [Bacteroidia bacterium]|nr:T9SS type A sorting domain-containing protein [Bacteroidia bacterium]
MKAQLFFTIYFSVYYLCCQAQNTWTQKANFPDNSLVGTFSFSIGNKGYVGGGSDCSGNFSNKFWEYDPFLNLWTQKANFAGGKRDYATSVSILGKGYVGLGRDSTYTLINDWWEYDPILNSWTQKGNFGGGSTFYPAVFTIENKAYICSGTENNTYTICTNSLWQYNPINDTWTQKASFPAQSRLGAFAFAINKKGYFGGGFYHNNLLPDFWEYNPIPDSWQQKATIPDSVWIDACAFSICGFGFLGVGENLETSSNFWQYNPVNDQWSQIATFPGTERDECAFFVINEKGYIGLGGDNCFPSYNDFYEYTPNCLTDLSEFSDSKLEIDFYHNPTSNLLNVNFNNSKKSTIEIINSNGTTIFSDQFINQETKQIDISKYAKGFYFVIIKSEDLIKVEKLIIE